MKPTLSIVIPTKDRGDIFTETLTAALEAANNIGAEIIVINDSKTGKPLIPDGVRIVDNPGNGVASARNFGASLATSDLLLFLDDDMLVSPFVLQTIIQFTTTHPNTVCMPNWEYPVTLHDELSKSPFGRFLLNIDYHHLRGWMTNKDWKSDEVPFEHPGLASYCLLLRKSDFEAIGGYNEAFSHAGYEDYDLKIKLIHHCFTFYVDPKSYIYHNERDRIELKSWLNRKRRTAQTQRDGVQLGYNELELKYTLFKKAVLELLLFIQPLSFAMLRLLNHQRTDTVYFKIVRMMIATHMYRGYIKDYGKSNN